MLDFPRWKYALVALLVIVGIIYAIPNIYPQDPAVQVTANRGAEVDDALRQRVERALEGAGLEFKSVTIEEGTLLARLNDLEVQQAAAALLREELGNRYNVALNLASTTPDWLLAIRATPMVLGLDLQGGVHFLMQVDEAAALEARETSFADDIRALMRDNRLQAQGNTVTRTATGIVVNMRSQEEADRLRSVVVRDLPELVLETRAVADGAGFVARLSEPAAREILDRAIEQNVGTLRSRINELGVAEPIIQRQGSNRIVVQLPERGEAEAIARLGGFLTDGQLDQYDVIRVDLRLEDRMVIETSPLTSGQRPRQGENT